MFKDALVAVTRENSKKICKLGSIVNSLDDETKEALIIAMSSSAATINITKILCSNGHSIGRDVVGFKRECFKNPSFNCCIRETIDKCLSDRKEQ